ncbi:MAG: N-6 DNA methylase [Planctomycetia bacterium]|nr:N-6 DNA methylase [Planctomycetia bacterium]
MDSVYRSFYTKSNAIVAYMVSKLELNPGDHVLEPCAGDGVFVDAVLQAQPNVTFDLYELNPHAIVDLNAKYGNDTRVEIHHADTLTDPDLSLKANFSTGYDRIIGNPPYGGWLEYEQRDFLKRLFPGMYVRETYSLFLFRCVDLLQIGGKLVFILPDTFLNLHLHKPLRKRLLSKCHIEEVAIFPSSFFPGVRYGYSKMCIITLRRVRESASRSAESIRIIDNLQNAHALLNGEGLKRRVTMVSQQVMADTVDHALFVSEKPRVDKLINECKNRLGDIADCVTGLYTGKDPDFLRPLHDAIRSAARYRTVDESEICRDYVDRSGLLNGLNGKRRFIPIMKGGRKRYYKPDEWYVDWSVEAIRAYRTHPKARFQNSEFYFRRGIGVPMVSSSSISAAVLEDRVFDQSIVGIFPRDEKWLHYLLGFFNTETCNTLIRTINPSANNSANYIKKIPFVVPAESTLRAISTRVKKIVTNVKEEGEVDASLHKTIEAMIAEVYGV